MRRLISPLPTPKQAKLLAYIRLYRTTHGVGPTMDEIGKHMGHRFATSTQRMIRALVRDERVRHTFNVARSIEVL